MPNTRLPTPLTPERAELTCDHCGKTIQDLKLAIYALVHETSSGRILDVYVAHKGDCDRALRAQRTVPGESTTRWEELSDATIPIGYMKIVMATLNRMRSGADSYTDEAFNKWKQLLLLLCQYVIRATTPEERERIVGLADLPPGV